MVHNGGESQRSRGNSCRFGKSFDPAVEALEDFPTQFIQSKTSAIAREYTDRNHASGQVMLLGNFSDEHRRVSPISEAGFRYQLALVSSTGVRVTQALGTRLQIKWQVGDLRTGTASDFTGP